ncbi:hypothetical protein [Massilia scottii]|uniref:hypothetical protein n=1 Tax=Massilia scottii TaxID=3057166 RepID=UPI0027969306|nr:hypothetical protein [Massilia sp. CCM 9029]MDQ1833749.1 hypothetical protein [Massilia sp. CCM 9029]
MTYPRTAGIRLFARLTTLMAALTLPAHSQAADTDTCTVALARPRAAENGPGQQRQLLCARERAVAALA